LTSPHKDGKRKWKWVLNPVEPPFFFFYFRGMSCDWSHMVCPPLFGILYQSRMLAMIVEHSVKWVAGETEVPGEKTCPSATMSTTWPEQGLNPSRRGGKPATNRLSYGTASEFPKTQYQIQRCVTELLVWLNLLPHVWMCPCCKPKLKADQVRPISVQTGALVAYLEARPRPFCPNTVLTFPSDSCFI
jgi:hypothetical protein